MKYIRFENGGFVIFPEAIGHNEVVVKGMFIGKPISAGKIDIGIQWNSASECELDIETYGESISLKLKADRKDGEYIKMRC